MIFHLLVVILVKGLFIIMYTWVNDIYVISVCKVGPSCSWNIETCCHSRFFQNNIEPATTMYGFSKQKSGIGSNMIQNYMEKQMNTLHSSSSQSVTNYKDKVISFLMGALVLVLLPYFHIGKFWQTKEIRDCKIKCP
jgi:hypothetical protein